MDILSFKAGNIFSYSWLPKTLVLPEGILKKGALEKAGKSKGVFRT